MRDKVQAATQYISEQSPYRYRLPRYQQVSYELHRPNPGDRPLLSCDTLVDLGAGWTDFDYHLRRDWNWQGRYFPVDTGLNGADLSTWQLHQKVAWVVIIETLEHLASMDLVHRLIQDLKQNTMSGIVVTVPDPQKVDVLAQCADHKTVIHRHDLETMGFRTRSWQNTLIGTWRPR